MPETPPHILAASDQLQATVYSRAAQLALDQGVDAADLSETAQLAYELGRNATYAATLLVLSEIGALRAAS